MPQQHSKKCAHKLAGQKRTCKNKAEPGSKYCWQHQEVPFSISKEAEEKLAKYMKIVEGQGKRKRRKNPIKRRKAAKKAYKKVRKAKAYKKVRKARKARRTRRFKK